VEEVRRRCEQDKFDLREKIERKLEMAEEKREAMLSNIQDRIRKHVSKLHVVEFTPEQFHCDGPATFIERRGKHFPAKDVELSRGKTIFELGPLLKPLCCMVLLHGSPLITETAK